MYYLIFFLIFIYGLIIGSFLNVCIFRIPQGQSILFPGSHCPNCEENIKWWQNIPFISYLILRGKCANCGEKINIRYPLVELFTGISYGVLYIIFGLSWHFIGGGIFFSLLLVISLIDIDTQTIPDRLSLFGFILLFTYKIFFDNTGFNTMLWGFLLNGTLFLLIVILSDGGMGGGDIRLAAILGMFLGWQHGLVAVFLAFIIGSITSIGILLFKGGNRKTAVPFGPFLSIGAMISYIWGFRLLDFYKTYIIGN